MGFFSRITGADKRRELSEMREIRRDVYKQRLTKMKMMDEAYAKLFEKETAQLGMNEVDDVQTKLKESFSNVNIGNPWWQDIVGLSLDQAWTRGFPTSELAFGWDAAAVANDDAARWHVMRVSRVLYDLHPHAKGIVETAVSFICGSFAWSVEPTPRIMRPDAATVTPLRESFDDEKPEAEGDPFYVPPVGDAVATVPTEPDKVPQQTIDDILDTGEKFDAEMPVDHRLAATYRRLWAQYIRRGTFHPKLGWTQFWKEAFRRTRRDGEVFIHKGHEEDDGRLAPRFIEPEDISHPSGMTSNSAMHDRRGGVFDQDANGIRVDKDDPDKVLGYWYKRTDDLDSTNHELIPADQMIHIKFGIDSGTRRGVPLMFVVRRYLQHLDSWIAQSLHHQRVQSSIALLRQWENTTPAQVRSLITSKEFRSFERNTPAGQTKDYRSTDMLPIIDAPAGMNMTMVSPNGNFADSEILVRRVLLAISVGVQQSEAMVTGDGSNANYASTRITQFIPLRSFEAEQGDWAETVQQFYEAWVYTEAAMGRIPIIRDECLLDVNVTPSQMPNFEAEIAAPTAISLFQAGLISRRTSQELVRLDPDVEEDRMVEEQAKLDEATDSLKDEMGGEDELDLNMGDEFDVDSLEDEEFEDEEFEDDEEQDFGEGFIQELYALKNKKNGKHKKVLVE